MKWSTWLTLQQHKEAIMLCEEEMIIIEARNAFSVPQITKQATPLKT